MNAIRNVFAAFANLAASINSLASIIDTASGRLRQQLALDVEPAPVLEHQANGATESTEANSVSEINSTSNGRRRRVS